MGGYGALFEETKKQATESVAAEDIVVMQYLSNPYALLAACDFFVLSSYYEGLPVVLTEADIVGLPCVSTDIPGPRGLMEKVGGLLVEDSEAGLVGGMKRCKEGQAPERFTIDYEEYNKEAVAQFEAMLSVPSKAWTTKVLSPEERDAAVVFANKERKQPNFYARPSDAEPAELKLLPATRYS